jgi:CheY-like chemotaxis protein
VEVAAQAVQQPRSEALRLSITVMELLQLHELGKGKNVATRNQDKTQPRMLIVDDDKIISSVLSEFGKGAGFEVASIHDGKEITGQLLSFDPHIIFLDLVMPGFDGVEVIDVLAEAGCNAKIVIMSGMEKRTLSMVSNLAKDKDLQLLGVMGKPFTAEEVDKFLAPVVKEIAELEPQNSASVNRRKIGPCLSLEPHMSLLEEEEGQASHLSCKMIWKLDDGETILLEKLLAKEDLHRSAKGLLDMLLRELSNAKKFGQKNDVAMTFSIPIMKNLINDPELPDILQEAIGALNLQPAEITLEIEDSFLVEDNKHVNNIISRIKIKGFGIAISIRKEADQVLASINSLAVDELLIDMSYGLEREGIQDDAELEFQFSSLASVASKAGVRTSAKNVTQKQQLEFARRCNFSCARGPYIKQAGLVDSILDFKQ